MTTARFPDKHATTYNSSYNQTVRTAMERGWSLGFIRGQVAEWTRQRADARWEADYLEHICGLLDALADLLISHGAAAGYGRKLG